MSKIEDKLSIEDKVKAWMIIISFAFFLLQV